MVGRADVPMLILDTVQAILDLLALFISPLDLVRSLLEVFVHDVFLFEIGDFTNAVTLESDRLVFP